MSFAKNFSLTKASVLITVTLLSTFLLMSSGTANATRYISAHNTNNIWLKDSSVYSPWTVLLNNVAFYNIESTQNRIAFIDTKNNLWVKENSIYAPWILLSNHVLDAKFVGNKIFIINSQFELYAKDGSIYAPWILLKKNTYNVAVSNNRILALSNYDGYTMDLDVKEGSIYSPWWRIDNPSANFNGNISLPITAVTDNRIAYFDGEYSNFKINEGSIYSYYYTSVYGGAGFNVQMSGERVCINVASSSKSRIFCKDGSLFSSWVLVHDNAYLNDILPNKISVSNQGNAYPKNAQLDMEGSLFSNTGWIHVDTGRYMVFSH